MITQSHVCKAPYRPEFRWQMCRLVYLAAALLLAGACADNSTAEPGACGLEPEGPWSAALQDWVTADQGHNARHGRIMALAPSHGYYVSDRIDLVPPPPPPVPHGHRRGPYPAHPGPDAPARLQGQPTHESSMRPQNAPPGQYLQNSGQHQQNSNQHSQNSGQHMQGSGQHMQGSGQHPQGSGLHPQGPTPMPYDEWQATPPPPPGAGKIVNRPPNPYKDQFKPSYPPPSPPQQIPVHGLADRADEAHAPPHRQVSETDLYLLGAIEKLVYRVDIMEKRLRKMEENMHYLVVGADPKPEPCQSNFTRVGGACYHVSSEALNWKGANYACRKLKGHLLELEADGEKQAFTAGLVADKNFKGTDYWTGGLNPGLLWIWAHSAAAVANTTADSKDESTIVGEGRCLALVHDPARSTYVYRGQDCGLRHRYVCEKNEDKTKLSNEISRAARALRRRSHRAHKAAWLDAHETGAGGGAAHDKREETST